MYWQLNGYVQCWDSCLLCSDVADVLHKDCNVCRQHLDEPHIGVIKGNNSGHGSTICGARRLADSCRLFLHLTSTDWLCWRGATCQCLHQANNLSQAMPKQQFRELTLS